MTSTTKFMIDINKFIAKTKLMPMLVMKKIAFDAFNGVIMRSPVRTGRFRGSWRIGLGSADLTVEDPSFKGAGTQGSPPTGEEAGQLTILNGLMPDQVIYITNNLPYAQKLERGSSEQAPNGMVAVTFNDIIADLRGI